VDESRTLRWSSSFRILRLPRPNSIILCSIPLALCSLSFSHRGPPAPSMRSPSMHCLQCGNVGETGGLLGLLNTLSLSCADNVSCGVVVGACVHSIRETLARASLSVEPRGPPQCQIGGDWGTIVARVRCPTNPKCHMLPLRRRPLRRRIPLCPPPHLVGYLQARRIRYFVSVLRYRDCLGLLQLSCSFVEIKPYKPEDGYA
jgi:hypothetical protein